MTTNHPEALDPALIRPGRVDYKVEFTLATRDQMYGMYLRMYEVDQHSEKTAKISENDALEASKGLAERAGIAFDVDTFRRGTSFIEHKALQEMAVLFTDRLPERLFSPAEIQGYLLERKGDPVGALREIEAWGRKTNHSTCQVSA